MVSINEDGSRIAIVGTYSVGKTTLAEALSSELGIPVSEDRFKILFAEKYPGKEVGNLSFHQALGLALKNSWELMAFERNKDSFVSDSGSLSELAHYVAFGERFWPSQFVMWGF